MEYKITLSDERVKALETDMLSIQEWINNAVHNKARQMIDVIVEQVSDKQSKKIPLEEKIRIIKEVKIETAMERQARLEAETKK